MIMPPGYRFLPTDQELICGYLLRRIMELPLPCHVVLERNLYGVNTAPCDVFGDIDECNSRYWHSEDHETKGVTKKTIYVFTKLVKASSNSSRIARRAGSGTWSGQTGAREIKRSNGEIIGSRKMFTFQDSNARKGGYHWIMHEYSLDGVYKNLGPNNVNNDFVLCKITRSFKGKPTTDVENNAGVGQILQPARTIENISGDVCDFSCGGVDQIPQPAVTIENNIESLSLCGNKRSLDEGVVQEDCEGLNGCGSKKPRISSDDDDNYASILEEQLLADLEDNNYANLLEDQLLADSGNDDTGDLFEGLEDIENLDCLSDDQSTVSSVL